MLYVAQVSLLLVFPPLIILSLLIAPSEHTGKRMAGISKCLVHASVVPLSISGILFVWILDPSLEYSMRSEMIGLSSLARPWLTDTSAA